jgi:hypothetical protein
MAGVNLSLPGLGALPPMTFGGAESSAALNQSGALFMASGPGDWNVNMGGSGAAWQAATGGVPLWLLAVLLGGGLWLLSKR